VVDLGEDGGQTDQVSFGVGELGEHGLGVGTEETARPSRRRLVGHHMVSPLQKPQSGNMSESTWST
jgi:hypothetical protein